MSDQNNTNCSQEVKEVKQDVCPNCGVCKACGRGGYQFIPWYPYYPYQPYYPTWTNGSLSENAHLPNPRVVSYGAFGCEFPSSSNYSGGSYV